MQVEWDWAGSEYMVTPALDLRGVEESLLWDRRRPGGCRERPRPVSRFEGHSVSA